MRVLGTYAGTSLLGFWGLSEGDFGDPGTPRPYARVTPSRAGGAVLPFPCPRCGETIDFSDPAVRQDHTDDRPGRGNVWCPWCGNRFYLRADGPGSTGSAPAVVERVVLGEDGEVRVEREVAGERGLFAHFKYLYLGGTDFLSAGHAGR